MREIEEEKGQESSSTAATHVHVLLLPYPIQGHINPLLQFGKHLTTKGIKVTLALTHFVANSMEGETAPITIEIISDGFDNRGIRGASSFEAYHASLKDIGSRTLTELIQRYASSVMPFTCLVYDAFLTWFAELALLLGLRVAAFFTQSCAVNAIYYYAHRGELIVPEDGESVLLPGLPGLELEASDLPSFVTAPEYLPSFRELFLNQFSNLERVDWVLCNTFDALESEEVNFMSKLYSMKTIGPTIPSMYLDKHMSKDVDYGLSLWNKNATICCDWLDTKASGSIVYVSFGSAVVFETHQMHEIAWGLHNSNKHFLWVVRATEEGKLPVDFVEESKEKGLVVPWCPQLEVLDHPAVGCFVTHCGWNSTLEGLSLGVPLVAVPRWTDQPTNAKYVEDVWRVGVRARVDGGGVYRREEIERCLREVMGGEKGEEIKKRAGKWRDLAVKAFDKGGSSALNLEEFVAQISN